MTVQSDVLPWIAWSWLHWGTALYWYVKALPPIDADFCNTEESPSTVKQTLTRPLVLSASESGADPLSQAKRQKNTAVMRQIIMLKLITFVLKVYSPAPGNNRAP